METDAYTPDAICRSLGVGDFREKWKRGQPHKRLRILLCPSFDPEMFIELVGNNNSLMVSITVARTQIWTLQSPGLVTTDQTSLKFDGWSFDELETAFRASLSGPPKSFVVIDGMSVHILLSRYSTTIEINDNPHGTPTADFLAEIVGRIYSATENVKCRNGLARAGNYVGLKLPVEAEPKPEKTTNMMVLGTPQDQGEILNALAKMSGREKSPKAKSED